jgi:AcrR family transcriptional regulator
MFTFIGKSESVNPMSKAGILASDEGKHLTDMAGHSGVRAEIIPVTARGVETRRKLISASQVVFARDGYEKARVADIVAEAGISHGNFYRHFPDKDAALLAVLEKLNNEIRQTTKSVTPRADLPDKAALVRRNTRFFDSYAQNRLLLRVSREAAARRDSGDFLNLWMAQRGAYIERTAGWLSRHVSLGHLRRDTDPYAMAEALCSMAEQMAYVYIGLAENDPPRSEIERLGRVVGEIWYSAIMGAATIEITGDGVDPHLR